MGKSNARGQILGKSISNSMQYQGISHRSRWDQQIWNEMDFRKYFKDKPESTELLPSWQHIRHYKAILGSKDLVSLMVAMIDIGLQSSKALEQWKHTVRIMLEKDKNSPTIDQLRIIQLFKANYNFFLALIFCHWLIKFKRFHCGFNELQHSSMAGKQAQSEILNKKIGSPRKTEPPLNLTHKPTTQGTKISPILQNMVI